MGSNIFSEERRFLQVLLTIIRSKIEKQFLIREPISAEIRLQILLHYLSTGNTLTSLSYEFRVGISTVCGIIRETCDAIWNTLSPVIFIQPCLEEWKKISKAFDEEWNFPHCIGAIDGRHIVIQVNSLMC